MFSEKNEKLKWPVLMSNRTPLHDAILGCEEKKNCISDFCYVSAGCFSLTCLMCVGELVMMVVVEGR